MSESRRVIQLPPLQEVKRRVKFNSHLFETSGELKGMLRALEHRRDDVALELLRRIDAQRIEAAALGKFGRELDTKRYVAAREMVPMLASGFMAANRLETLLLAIEIDFIKAAARAQRSTSGKRYLVFWNEFDAVARRRTCRTAESVYQAVLAAGIPGPHPKLSVAKKRYGKLKHGTSETCVSLCR